MATSTVRAGSLVWDLDVGKQEEALRKVQALGRKLDEALNKNRASGKGVLESVAADADKASNRITVFQQEFTRLNVQLKSGQLTATQYGQGLRTLQANLQTSARAANLNAAEYRNLNTLIPRVARAQATLGGTTADVVAKTQALAGEIRRLRNDWQRTGESTDDTKRRLAELANETARYAGELKTADGGTQRFGRQLDQLAVAGRSAQATIDGMEGRMSRLGLASQVNLGAMRALQGQLSSFGPTGRLAGAGIGIVSEQFSTMSTGAMLASGGLLAVAAAGGALAQRGIPEVKEMQTAWRVLVASGEDLKQAELDRTLADIQEAAGRAGTQFRRAEIATALSEIVKAGVNMNAAMNLLTPGMQLATVTGQTLNETTMLLLGNLRQFGLGVEDAGRAADALAEADLAAAESARELSEGLGVVGPVAAAAGFSLEDTLGILVELSNKGMSAASVGATALRGTLSALLDPTDKARAALKGLGVELTDGQGRSRPLLTVLQELRDALEGNGEAAQIAAQIFDTRAITAIMNMTTESDSLADALRGSHGALQAYSDTVTDKNLESSQAALSNAVADLALAFAGTFADDITAVTNSLAAFIRQIGKFGDASLRDKILIFQDLLGFNPISPERQQRLDNLGVPTGSGGRTGGVSDVWLGPDFRNPAAAFGPQPASSATAGSPMAASIDELIAEATRLKKTLDAAKDPKSWLAAQAAVDEFRGSSERAAAAWQAVVATLGGRTSTARSGKPEKTVQDVFDNLATSGTKAEQRALAFGDTLDARLESTNTRAKLVSAAINELINDLGLDAMDAKVQYLVARLAELEAEAERLKTAGKPVTLGVKPTATIAQGWLDGQRALDAYQASLVRLNARAELGLVDDSSRLREEIQATQTAINSLTSIYGDLTADQQAELRELIRTSGVLEAELAKLERQADRVQRQRARAAARQVELDDDNATAAGGMTLAEWRADRDRRQAEADAKAKEQAAAAAEAAKQARLRANELRQEQLNVSAQAHTIGLQITQAVKAGSVEGLQDLETTILGLLEQYADSALGAVFAGLLTRLRAGRAELNAQVEEEARRAQEKAERLTLNARRAESMAIQRDAQRLGVQVTEAIRGGTLEGLQSLEDELVQRLNELGDDPAAAPFVGLLTRIRAAIEDAKETTADTIDDLRWRIIALRSEGLEPTSAAVQELVRRINELQLKAALDELRTKGVKGLSDFAKEVLRANGILPTATKETKRFSDALRGLGGNDIAAGLADVIDGIRDITAAAGDAEKTVAALTTILQGATKVIEGLSSGDAFSTMKNFAMVAGEGIGMATGIPGVGQLVGAAFDLGKVIVDAISDAFTGDSPAARAIRDGLSMAVQSAFTTGIMAALQRGENWRENLRDGVKLAFLTGLIEAFVKTAIIQAYLDPIFYEYSKMLARGQYDAAAEFLANSLPAAVEASLAQVDKFVASLPPGLIPKSPGGGPPEPTGSTGLFELPTATVTGIAAPTWARDLVNAGQVQLQASRAFADAVALLTTDGIVVKTAGGSGAGGGSSATARAA